MGMKIIRVRKDRNVNVQRPRSQDYNTSDFDMLAMMDSMSSVLSEAAQVAETLRPEPAETPPRRDDILRADIPDSDGEEFDLHDHMEGVDKAALLQVFQDARQEFKKPLIDNMFSLIGFFSALEDSSRAIETVTNGGAQLDASAIRTIISRVAELRMLNMVLEEFAIPEEQRKELVTQHLKNKWGPHTLTQIVNKQQAARGIGMTAGREEDLRPRQPKPTGKIGSLGPFGIV